MYMVEALKRTVWTISEIMVMGQWNASLSITLAFLPPHTIVYKGKATTLPHLCPPAFEKALIVTI